MVWADIDFGGAAKVTGYDLGGLAPNPIWVSNDFLEANLSVASPNDQYPNGDVVDFQALMDFISTHVIPANPGTTSPSFDTSPIGKRIDRKSVV